VRTIDSRIVAALALLVAVGLLTWWRTTRSVPPPPPANATPHGGPLVPDAGAAAAARATDEAPADDPLAALAARGEPWAAVDLNALRAELPDNLFWKMSAPTRDAAVLREREEERERWNVEYGKVLSSTASADEVDTYYAHRYRLSSDYVKFATLVLADYGERLSARDVALLKLAIELHLARLEEIPRQIEDAHQRREAHDAARRAWLEEQKAFEGRAPATTP